MNGEAFGATAGRRILPDTFGGKGYPVFRYKSARLFARTMNVLCPRLAISVQYREADCEFGAASKGTTVKMFR